MKAGHMNQENMLSVGNAMSRRADHQRDQQLLKAPVKIGMITKKIMIVPCIVNSLL